MVKNGDDDDDDDDDRSKCICKNFGIHLPFAIFFRCVLFHVLVSTYAIQNIF